MTTRAPEDGSRAVALGAVEPARELLARDAVRAVCLFGSSARGAVRPGSDVDLLALVDGDSDAALVRPLLRSLGKERRVQVRLMTIRGLHRSFEKRTVFATHLAREGIVLADRDGTLDALIRTYPKNAPVEENAAALSSQLEAYADLDWCGGYYLFCLADLYAWSRAAAMLVLAREAVFEFDRDGVFDLLADRHPALAEDAMVTRALRPFWLTVHRDRETKHPFSAVGCDAEAERARDACRAIVASGL